MRLSGPDATAMVFRGGCYQGVATIQMAHLHTPYVVNARLISACSIKVASIYIKKVNELAKLMLKKNSLTRWVKTNYPRASLLLKKCNAASLTI